MCQATLRRLSNRAESCQVRKVASLLTEPLRKEGELGVRSALLPLAAMTLTLLTAVGTLLALAISPAQGAVPNGFTQSQVASGLAGPMDMEFAPDGRLFVAEEAGKVRIVKPNGTLATFLDISSKVDIAGERGLMGVTFDPNFATNHFVYLYYTRKATATTPVHNRVVRVTASGDSAIAGSEVLVFRLNNQSAQIHQGGALDFGNDGKLYLSTGDNATPGNAQSPGNLFGKVLRINKDGTIPTNNPFYATASGNNRAIWALGLRNPFKFAVKPGTSTIFINDVGEDTWEEINQGAAGANYGWPIYEGPESDAKYIPPIFAYGHGSTNTTGCSITGGAFYNPATVQFPSGYVGDYFFADFCNGWIRRYDPATDKAMGFATGLGSIVDLDVNKDGSLYYLSRGNPGLVGKIGH
jgi:glucose/arabinose dehydrogenase